MDTSYTIAPLTDEQEKELSRILANCPPGPLQACYGRAAKGYDYEMKSWPWFYREMIAGRKKHDMRDKRKRSYKVGDRVLLREWDPRSGSYSGEQCVFEITYITSNDSPCALSSGGLDRNMAILSMSPVMETMQ
ncbi:DUF3850 domain-containing protein [Sphingobium sp. MK2]|uniref:DUF3850 domain-containing protein n=1 Tax=Sphingobium sp. MK2 TaxID=3116540 RepID=UPI0032E362A7